jgi:hypothetical protein
MEREEARLTSDFQLAKNIRDQNVVRRVRSGLGQIRGTWSGRLVECEGVGFRVPLSSKNHSSLLYSSCNFQSFLHEARRRKWRSV